MKKSRLIFIILLTIMTLNSFTYAQENLEWQKNIDIQVNSLCAACYGNNLFVVVGYDGAIKTSTDGYNWSTINSGVSSDLYDVIWDTRRFIAVGDLGSILISHDGINWIKKESKFKGDFRKILWDGKQYFAFSRIGYEKCSLIKSTDGEVWEEISTLPTNEISAIAYGNNKYVIVGSKGTILISTDGLKWVEKTFSEDSEFFDIIYNGEMFVAVGNSIVLSSVDGEIWNSVNNETAETLRSLGWNGSKFVVLGYGTVLTSTDGYSWNMSETKTRYVSDIAGNNDVFIAVGVFGEIFTSRNGSDWECVFEIMDFDFTKVIWQENQFVGIGRRNSIILTSKDGKEWFKGGFELYNKLSGISWDGEKFLVVGSKGAVLISSDGITWEVHDIGESDHYNSVIWDGNKFIAVGSSGSIITSYDGLHWTKSNSGTTESLRCIAWNGNMFVAVGTGVSTKIIVTSEDGINWTTRLFDDEASTSFNSVIWGGNKFISVAGDGLIMTSPDGKEWSAIETGITNSINDIIWTGNMYVAVGNYGVVLTSTDGVEWNISLAPTSVSLNSIAWNGNQLIIASDNTTIITCIPKDIIKVHVNGKPIIFDTAPIIKDGRILVPLRYIFEALGAEVKWDVETRTFTGTKGSNTIILKVDSKNSIINGQYKELDVSSTIINGRTYVPVRFITESLGAKVEWDNDLRTAVITTEN